MKTISFLISIAFLGVNSGAFAQSTSAKGPWEHESSLSIVSSSGNTTSDTYQAKQKTAYSIEASKLTATGSYLDGRARQADKTTGAVTEVKSRKWDAGLRYDFSFTETAGAFLGHMAESDSNAGFVQRDSTDLGAKYVVFKNEGSSLQTEVGFRYSKTYDGSANDYATFARLYAEYGYQINSEVSTKFWIEHLPNLKDSDKYLTNAELSISATLSTLLSLKTSYLAKYRNATASTAVYEDKHVDALFTTALVAKF